jgi:hypothetical protein
MLSTAIPRRDPERKKRILKAKIDEPSLKNWEIAVIANCSSDYVGKVLKNHRATTHQAEAAELLEPAPAGPEAAAQNPSWNFEKAVETNLAGLRAALEGGPLQQRKRPSRPSTNLLDPSRVRPITERELKAHTFGYDLNSTDPNEIKRSRSWLRNHLSGGKRGSQGFVIMDAHDDKDGEQRSAIFDQLPKLCDNPRYSKEFKTIFQKLQAKEAKGDGKRKQAKMTDLVKLAALRVKEAGNIARRKLQNKGQPGRKRARGNKIKNRVTKEAALETLEQMEEEYHCIVAATHGMCEGYDRIQKVVALSKPCSSCLC